MRSAGKVTRWIADKLAPLLTVPRGDSGGPSLSLNLQYAKDSDLIFRGKKQKIFALSSAHGLDLIQNIREQIRAQSSEYRLLPSVPSTGADMASKALLAAPDATLQVDALRKADAVSVRRLGVSLLLRDIEVYSADLEPNSWRDIRYEFYGLVKRHLITPAGFFAYSGYLPRVFGLMVASRDYVQADEFIDQFKNVIQILEETSDLGTTKNRAKFRTCVSHYAVGLRQTALQAATERGVRRDAHLLRVIRRLHEIDEDISLPSSIARLEKLTRQILLADWGRRPYKDFWYLSQHEDELGPPVPKESDVRRNLRIGGIRPFRKLSKNLKIPYWPALVFRTRPMRVDEIALVAPDVLHDSELYRKLIMVLRGAKVASHSVVGFVEPARRKDGSRPPYRGPVPFVVPGRSTDQITLAVTSYRTTEKQWRAAAQGKPDRSASRFRALNVLINRILQEKDHPHYVVLPELSIPLRWALRIARKLAMTDVSFLAGVEYHTDRTTGAIRNDCLISLTTNWPGYRSHVVFLQPKFAPAHEEKRSLRKINSGPRSLLYRPTGNLTLPTLYIHKGFHFSVLICSDLTNIFHRNMLRGKIDALFVLEWNRDLTTFASLVEATAADLHAFVAQVNNREYGDSRVRAPAALEYKRDIIQVKGGCSDYYVLGKVNFLSLRKEQRSRKSGPMFKPTPIGFKMSDRRKTNT